ncbi:hypothetical protein UFOVP386_13 [uncultured Caudovirales phage]|uniref:Uncharacterized protein n=1 Tax=uncultured Caudovirales phage TaxID=2100421 RepID=A0A6J7X0I7_9CAUD|nr:hypothetical protein UFOVP386_13 [uncultured Caudovirales phage]
MSKEINIAEGIVGTIASITLAIPLYHEEIEFIIRIMSGIFSISAGIFTMIAMYKKIKKYGNDNL